MPAARMISELDSGAELLVHYALLDGTQWHFQDAQLISARSQLLNTYPSYAEATAVLGSELRPTLARLKAVLDRLRLQYPRTMTAEASLQRMSTSYVVRHYAAFDEGGRTLYQWRNPALQPPTPVGQRATG